MEVAYDVPEGANYRLLQLTPKLQKSLEAGELVIKSSGSLVNICTADSTHTVRRLKQSNTLLLLRPQNEKLVAFAAPFEHLETVLSDGKIDWSLFPEYSSEKSIVPEKLDQQISCSPAEFAAQCKSLPAIEIDGNVYKLSSDLVHEVLVEVVSRMVEEGNFELNISSKQYTGPQPAHIVDCCLTKFKNDEGNFDKTELSRWTGLYILQQHPKGCKKAQFLREWTMDLPVKLETSMDLLKGQVALVDQDTVCFIDSSNLSNIIQERLEQLFQIKSEWLLTEIEPFVLSLMPVGQRLENWILKFAKKRRLGKDSVVSRLRR